MKESGARMMRGGGEGETRKLRKRGKNQAGTVKLGVENEIVMKGAISEARARIVS